MPKNTSRINSYKTKTVTGARNLAAEKNRIVKSLQPRKIKKITNRRK